MSKFWTVVTLLFVIGIGFIFLNNGTAGVNFTDLETECRYDMTEKVKIDLTEKNRLLFNGNYPVNNPESELNFGYSKSENRIVLNVKSKNLDEPKSFLNNCLGSVVYEAETQQLTSGNYEVTVRHNGEKVKRQVIRVR